MVHSPVILVNSKLKQHSSGWKDRYSSDHCDIFIVLDDLCGDGQLIIRLMSQPQPPSDLGVDVFHPFFFFFVPAGHNYDLIISELIAVSLICYDNPSCVLVYWVHKHRKAQPN